MNVLFPNFHTNSFVDSNVTFKYFYEHTLSKSRIQKQTILLPLFEIILNLRFKVCYLNLLSCIFGCTYNLFEYKIKNENLNFNVPVGGLEKVCSSRHCNRTRPRRY